MRRRVVITGMGAITPIGLNVADFWANIKKGVHGIGPITYFDTAEYKAKLAAEVKGFDAKQYMDLKSARRMEQFSQFAVAATKEAFEYAKLDMEKENPYMVGVAVGSGIGSLQAMEREYSKLIEKGPGRVAPLLVPMMISNRAAGNVAIAFGCKGKNINVVTACATGTNCIGEAFRSILYGEVDVMLAGGTESSITPIGKDRNGFIMGEGAGVLVLEELEHAKNRGAHIYAEMAGYGATCDAFHITSPAEDGSGAAKAMELAINDAGISPKDIDYVNAHGTGTHHNDLFETKAIKIALGEHAKEVGISSTKSMVGHLLGAAGGVEAIVCVKSIEDGFMHKNVGLTDKDPECDLDFLTEPRECEVNAVISNSLGFGGHNASIVIKKFVE